MSKLSLTAEVSSELEVMQRTIKIWKKIKDHQPIGINRLSAELDIEEHKVRYSLRLLQRVNIIEPTSGGAVLTEEHQENEKKLIRDIEKLKNTIENIITDLSE